MIFYQCGIAGLSSFRSQPVESLPSKASGSEDKVVRLEYWNTGIMGTAHSITLKNTTIHVIYRNTEA